MKKILLVFVVIFASAVFAADTGSDTVVANYWDAVIGYRSVTAQQPPFNYIKNVYQDTTGRADKNAWSLTAGNFVVPAGVIGLMVKCAHAGILKCRTWTDTSKLYMTSYDIEPVNVRGIFATGTTCDSCVVYGKRTGIQR